MAARIDNHDALVAQNKVLASHLEKISEQNEKNHQEVLASIRILGSAINSVHHGVDPMEILDELPAAAEEKPAEKSGKALQQALDNLSLELLREVKLLSSDFMQTKKDDKVNQMHQHLPKNDVDREGLVDVWRSHIERKILEICKAEWQEIDRPTLEGLYEVIAQSIANREGKRQKDDQPQENTLLLETSAGPSNLTGRLSPKRNISPSTEHSTARRHHESSESEVESEVGGILTPESDGSSDGFSKEKGQEGEKMEEEEEIAEQSEESDYGAAALLSSFEGKLRLAHDEEDEEQYQPGLLIAPSGRRSSGSSSEARDFSGSLLSHVPFPASTEASPIPLFSPAERSEGLVQTSGLTFRSSPLASHSDPYASQRATVYELSSRTISNKPAHGIRKPGHNVDIPTSGPSEPMSGFEVETPKKRGFLSKHKQTKSMHKGITGEGGGGDK